MKVEDKKKTMDLFNKDHKTWIILFLSNSMSIALNLQRTYYAIVAGLSHKFSEVKSSSLGFVGEDSVTADAV
jgi:hypothetical protein